MKNSIHKYHFCILFLVVCGCSFIAMPNKRAQTSSVEFNGQNVKAEFLHAWNGYKKYAWGNDDLKPLSKKPHNWYGHSLLFSPVDAYDTMKIMGLEKEARETKELILEKLDFDQDIDVRHFEVVIRLLGGLISAYQMDGDDRFLEFAVDLADRMLPVFDSPTGMPYRYVNLRTGEVSGGISNSAEVGTSIIEYGTLSRLTGNPVYYEKSKKAMVALYERHVATGLAGGAINVETGEWVGKTAHIGAGIDSYYEYMLKGWLLFGDEDLREMWNKSKAAIDKYLAHEVDGKLWYGRVDMETGKRTSTYYGALDAFFPAVLVLDGDMDKAARLQSSGFDMWRLHGIEPEILNYRKMKVVIGIYMLRPEIIESAYYLYQRTGDEKYRDMGRVVFNDLIAHCKVDAGYASLIDVRWKLKLDRMESFFFAETLKYLYLLAVPKKQFDFEKVVFNTEAHPVFKTWE